MIFRYDVSIVVSFCVVGVSGMVVCCSRYMFCVLVCLCIDIFVSVLVNGLCCVIVLVLSVSELVCVMICSVLNIFLMVVRIFGGGWLCVLKYVSSWLMIGLVFRFGECVDIYL